MTVSTWRDHSAAQWEAGAAVPSWVFVPEAMPPADVLPRDRGVDLLDGAVVGSWLWILATAALAAGLAAVLIVLGLRRAAARVAPGHGTEPARARDADAAQPRDPGHAGRSYRGPATPRGAAR